MVLLRQKLIRILTVLVLIITGIYGFNSKLPKATAANLASPLIPMGGGSGLVLPVKNDPFALGLCTLGAIGRDDYGRLIGITAGHCGQPGEQIQAENFRSAGDVGKIIESNAFLDYAIILFYKNKVLPVRQIGNGVAINKISKAPLEFGQNICKTGRTTGTNCGIVWDADQSTHTSSLCVLEGDSGGPVTRNNELVGIVTAYIGGSLPIGCFPSPETGTNIGAIINAWDEGFKLVW